MSDGWAKTGIIFGGLSLIVGGLGVLVAIFTPEVRCFFGVKSDACLSQSASIKSDVGADYQKLQNLLILGDFEGANLETRRLMLRIAGSTDSLDKGDIVRFPCTNLLSIDTLWLKHSNNKFGFSVQEQIWQATQRSYLAFEERVGWRINGKWVGRNNLKFDLQAPQGHLPDNFFIMPDDKNFSLESKLRSCRKT